MPRLPTARRTRARLGRCFRALLPGPTTFMRVVYSVPRQVVLVTASDDSSRALWPVDWHMPIGFEPPRYALSVGAHGHGAGVLRRAGCFVVNMVPASWEHTIMEAGRTSGAAGDKFSALGLPVEQAAFVDTPYLPGRHQQHGLRAG